MAYRRPSTSRWRCISRASISRRSPTARRLDADAVYEHFADAIEKGVVEARDVLDLEDADIDEVLSVFERLDTLETGKLEPAHAALRGTFRLSAF